jgi:hypothetical protein
MEAYREVSVRRAKERRADAESRELPEVTPEERAGTLAAMREYMAGIGRPMVEERNTAADFDPNRNGYDPDRDIEF